ncbi:pilus assembly protein CpaF [Salipiger aestuarii]|uniref:PIN domain-containing protein n=1 Tax=Salipiger aestuarii TaxID=568098 RepID=A0A327XZU2_9RHOB|nr:type II toxin-antitoxin system VapC family toxin [Salipiger aestuarii]KAB2536272.1 pilus assembly protein CpaF [Salipiger aestuarii]RAK14064.1 hypothetical protein ATI53_103029 [Salipiger aestuarii]
MIRILDTTILSLARRADRAPQIAAWLRAQDEATLYLSVITLGEIERGIALQDRHNPGFARDLRQWLETTVRLFADRLIDFTAEDAWRWGALSARIGHPGADLMIAAQALTRDAVMVTCNVRDFEPAGVRMVDPSA